MIEQIRSLKAFYPIMLDVHEADDYWRNQMPDPHGEPCLLRIDEFDAFDIRELWKFAYAHKALTGVAAYCCEDGLQEYVLAFPTKADAMLFKLAFSGE